jgi:hypothetical protein
MGLNTAALAPATNAQTADLLTLDGQGWNRRAAIEGASPAQTFSVEDRAEAEKRFAIIEPLVSPEKFPAIWQQGGGRKLAVVEQLAAEHRCKARTIRLWMMRYGRFGVQGLVDKDRSDKGSHRKINCNGSRSSPSSFSRYSPVRSSHCSLTV